MNCPNCGTENSDENKWCGKCGNKLELHEQQADEAFPPVETQVNLNNTSSKKKKIIIIVSAIVCLFIVVGILFYFLGIPLLKYQSAIKDLDNGNYSSAKAVFIELGDYKEAPSYILEADYQIAKQVAETELLKGLESLKNMGSYKDSEELVINQKNRIFEAAKSCINNHLFSEAEEYLNAIPDMEGVSDCKKELIYQRALDYEDKCKYSSSKTEFEKIRGYKDVNKRLDGLNYQLDGGHFLYGEATGHSVHSMSVDFFQGTLRTNWMLGYSVSTATELKRNYFYRIENNVIYGVIKSDSELFPETKPSKVIGKITNIVKDKNGKITRIQISGLFTEEPVWFDRM